jgi:DNA-3-methyladenine glycosylase
MKKLTPAFYGGGDVVGIASALLGKIIVTKFDDKTTISRIVETEAYAGPNDKASHAYGGKRTKRNEVMYGEAGFSYVYLCYGIHHLFNVVTNVQGIPHAVLIRASEPIFGIETMLERSGKEVADFSLTRGPGNFSRAMGIRTHHNGISLQGEQIFIADDDVQYPQGIIKASARIGVDYAAEDAALPYRFFVSGNPYVSGKPK